MEPRNSFKEGIDSISVRRSISILKTGRIEAFISMVVLKLDDLKPDVL
jgi:hypothetical protein